MEKNIENKILGDIEMGYDQMAEKFSQTRKYFWPGFEFISERLQTGDKLLDFGCGNGRLLEVIESEKVQYFGVDVSAKLIELAQKRTTSEKVNFQKISSSSRLPFSDNFFNKTVSISVFHHFPKKYAKEMAKEIYRVTKPDGLCIISVWNLWQGKYLKYLFDFSAIWKKILQSGEFQGLGIKDIFIPFKNNQGQIFKRFHHIYSQKELVEIFKAAGFRVEKYFVLNKRNIVLIGIK